MQDPEGCTLSENLNMTVFPAAVKTYLEHTWTFSPLALFSFYARQMNEILLPRARVDRFSTFLPEFLVAFMLSTTTEKASGPPPSPLESAKKAFLLPK